MSRLKSKLVKKIITAAAITVTACSDAGMPSAPQVNQPNSFVAPGATIAAVHRNQTQGATESVTKVIGSAGGTISVGDVTLTVPQGALLMPVAITATVPEGDVAQVEFEPHGLVFLRPFTLTFDNVDAASAVGVYFDGSIVDGLINVLQAFPTTVTASTATFQSWHFSGYAIAEG